MDDSILVKLKNGARAVNQKRVEKYYLDEARKVSSIFPAGVAVNAERPDFLILSESSVIGVEVTELCSQGPRSFAGKQELIVRRAKQRYMSTPSYVPVDVTAAFSPQAETIPGRALIDHLATFVKENLNDSKSQSHPRFFDHSKGYIHIGIHSVWPTGDPSGKWVGMSAFAKTVAPRELIEEYIADKNDKVAAYHESAPVVWLLLVSDQFAGTGEVYARPDDLAKWQFDFAFEKVLLFTREIGDGGSEVHELRRR